VRVLEKALSRKKLFSGAVERKAGNAPPSEKAVRGLYEEFITTLTRRKKGKKKGAAGRYKGQDQPK